MSKNDKKEINYQTWSLNNDNVSNQQDIYRNNQRVYNRIVERNNETTNHLNKLLMSQKKYRWKH